MTSPYQIVIVALAMPTIVFLWMRGSTHTWPLHAIPRSLSGVFVDPSHWMLSDQEGSSQAEPNRHVAQSSDTLPPPQLRIAPVSLNSEAMNKLRFGAHGVYALGWVDVSSAPPPSFVCEQGCAASPSPTSPSNPITPGLLGTWVKSSSKNDAWSKWPSESIALQFSAPARFPTCPGTFRIPVAWADSMWFSHIPQVAFTDPHPVLLIGGKRVVLNLPAKTVTAAGMWDACMSPNTGGLMNCFGDVNNYETTANRLKEINETNVGGINFLIWGGDNGYGRDQSWDTPGNLPHVYHTSFGGLDFLTTIPMILLMGNHEYDQDFSHGCSTNNGSCTNDAGGAPYVAFAAASPVRSWYANPNNLCSCSSAACTNSNYYTGMTKPVDWRYTLGFYAIGDIGVIVVDGRWCIDRLLVGDAEFTSAVLEGLENMRNAGVLEQVWLLSHWNAAGQGGCSSSKDIRRYLLNLAKTRLSPPLKSNISMFAFSGHAHVNVLDSEPDAWVLGGNGQSWGASDVGCGCASQIRFDASRKTSVDWKSPGGMCATHCTVTGR